MSMMLPQVKNAVKVTESDVNIMTPDGTADAYFVEDHAAISSPHRAQFFSRRTAKQIVRARISDQAVRAPK